MIDFNMNAFSGELARIKIAQAEVKSDQLGRKRWKEVARVLAQNISAGALGAGAGTALGYGTGEILRRTNVFRSMTPTQLNTVRNVSGVLGAIGSLALMNAMRKAQQRVEAVPK